MIQVELPTLIDFIGMSSAFMLGLLFLSREFRNRKSNLFLGLFLMCLSLDILDTFIANIIENNDLQLNVVIPAANFTLPFFVLYTLNTINYRIHNWIYVVLFLPGILAIFLPEPDLILALLLGAVHQLGILFFLLKVVRDNKRKLLNFYSETEHLTVKWIKGVVYLYLTMNAMWLIEDSRIIPGDLGELVAMLFPVLSSMLTFAVVYWVGYNGFTQQKIFDSEAFQFDLEEKETPCQEQNSEEEMEFRQLDQFIREKELFLDSKLNLYGLAEQLEINPKKLSFFINTYSGTNYYSYINAFRIERFKSQATDPKFENLSIEGMARNAGFSSKSTFYKVFKESEGMTPRQFMEGKSTLAIG